MDKTFMMKTAMALALTISLFSCASSRHQDGFSYRPAYAGPDMGTETAVNDNTPVSAPTAVAPVDASATQNVQVSETSVPQHTKQLLTLDTRQSEAMMDMVQTGMQHMAHEPGDMKETMRVMASGYAAKHDVQLSGKQLKKLDRLAVKMEKKFTKKQGPNVSWGPSNNLEWAILGAAAVGLFVGIFGIGFGWFIFLVAALAYLYFKLLHNN